MSPRGMTRARWCAAYDCGALWLFNFQDGGEGSRKLLSRSSLEPLISLDLVGTKLYCFRARVHCYHCLYIIFSTNPVRRSEELRGGPAKEANYFDVYYVQPENITYVSLVQYVYRGKWFHIEKGVLSQKKP